MANSQQHPEEIECFRTPGEGRFSPDKCYEYTYATRKSWEYIPELGRQDWRYFTNKGFTYAGKWLRNDRNGWRDSGDCWEVFRSNGDGNGHGETIVYWDYAATLCWRECRCYDDDDNEVRTVTRTIMDEMITAIEENVSIVPTVGESDGGGGGRKHQPRTRIGLSLNVFSDYPVKLDYLTTRK